MAYELSHLLIMKIKEEGDGPCDYHSIISVRDLV
jgi:hypothetical protein